MSRSAPRAGRPSAPVVRLLFVAFVAFAPLVALTACSRDIPLGSDQLVARAGAAPNATGGTAGLGEGGGAGAGEPTCVPVSCRGTVYACGNCRDDDGDGLVDALDPECTGPCDDREDSLDVGLPGSSAQSCQKDCFFDRGNGAGNDGCRYDDRCDPLSVAPDYPPSGKASCAFDSSAKIPGGSESCAELDAAQADSCSTVCGQLTPNGCDCFGCCELPADSGHYQLLATGLDCTPVKSCLNSCEPCESCVGRPAPLPSCTGATEACATDYEPCNPRSATLCPGSAYCITGCCVPEPR